MRYGAYGLSGGIHRTMPAIGSRLGIKWRTVQSVLRKYKRLGNTVRENPKSQVLQYFTNLQ